MPIVPSRSAEIQGLAQRLGQGRAADRESAIARLTLQGERALPALLAVLRQGVTAARVDALAVIEQHHVSGARSAVHLSVEDPDLPVALRAIEACVCYPDAGTVATLRKRTRTGPPALRLAAVESLLALLEEGLVEAMDPLLERILEAGEDEEVRRAAARALRSLSPRERAPLLARLHERSHDPTGRRLLQPFLERPLPEVPEGPMATAERPRERGRPAPGSARSGSAPKNRRGLRDTIDRLVENGGPASITALHALLERLPRADEKAAQAPEVTEIRGRIHRALAALGSRIAVYDLRESLAVRPAPAPLLLLGAAQTVGDASLVPALAALGAEEPSLQDACVSALTAIVRRERLRRTSAAVKSVRPAHRAILDQVWARPLRQAAANTAGNDNSQARAGQRLLPQNSRRSGQRGTTSRKIR